jgi:hypothetical protein
MECLADENLPYRELQGHPALIFEGFIHYPAPDFA